MSVLRTTTADTDGVSSAAVSFEAKTTGEVVAILDLAHADFTGAGVLAAAGANPALIASVEIITKGIVTPFTVVSTPFNSQSSFSNEATDGQPVRIKARFESAARTTRASYDVSLKFTLTDLTHITYSLGDLRVIGELPLPVITEAIPFNGGASIRVTVTPNKYDGVSSAYLLECFETMRFNLGGEVIEKDFNSEGTYEFTGLTVGTTYSFQAQLVATNGDVGVYTATTDVVASNRPAAFGSLTIRLAPSGGFVVSYPESTRSALTNGTDAQKVADQLTNAKVFFRAIDANIVDRDLVLDSEADYTQLGNPIDREVMENGDSKILAGDLSSPANAAYYGKTIRAFIYASNGHGAGARFYADEVEVLPASVTAPALAAVVDSVNRNKYHITVTPNAAESATNTGYTLIGHELEVKDSNGLWSGALNCPGVFSEVSLTSLAIMKSVDQAGASNAKMYLRAINEIAAVESDSNLYSAVTSMLASNIDFTVNSEADLAPAKFDVRVRSMYVLTSETAQVLSTLARNDLVLTSDAKKLQYTSNGDTGTFTEVATGSLLGAGSKKSAWVYSNLNLVVDKVAYTGALSSVFESIVANDLANFSLIMDRFDDVRYPASTHNLAYKVYSVSQNGSTLTYNDLNAAATPNPIPNNPLNQVRLSTSVNVAQGGQGTRVVVKVEVSTKGATPVVVAESAYTGSIVLGTIGKDAYSLINPCTLVNATQAVANELSTSKWSILNREAFTGDADLDCEVHFALKTPATGGDAAPSDEKVAVEAGISSSSSIAWVRNIVIRPVVNGVEGDALTSADYDESWAHYIPSGTTKIWYKKIVISGLQAMKAYIYKVYRNWTAGDDITMLDTAPLTIQATPVIPLQQRIANFTGVVDGAEKSVDCVFTNIGGAELNNEYQLKLIAAQNLVVTKVSPSSDYIYNKLNWNNPSNKFTVALAAGDLNSVQAIILNSTVQYIDPNHVATMPRPATYYHNAGMYVRSAISAADRTITPAALPSQILSTSLAYTTRADDFTLTFPVKSIAVDAVNIYAAIDDKTFNDQDKWVSVALNQITGKLTMTHADLIAALGSTVAEYYNQDQGISFMFTKVFGEKESRATTVVFYPKGASTLEAGDFDVVSADDSLIVKYKRHILKANEWIDLAGRALIPAIIQYTNGSTSLVTRRSFADITAADGCVLTGLDNLISYSNMKIEIAGNTAPILDITGAYSPAVKPLAFDLEVSSDAAGVVHVKFEQGSSYDLGEYSAPTNRIYVTLLVNGNLKYAVKAGAGFTQIATKAEWVLGATYAVDVEHELVGLNLGDEYSVILESTFAAAADNTQQILSASKVVVPSAKPEILDFRLDSANNVARMMYRPNGSPLNSILLFPLYTGSGSAADRPSLIHIDSASTSWATLGIAEDKYDIVPVSFALPANVANIMAIMCNGQGVDMGAANNAQGGQDTKFSETVHYSKSAHGQWVNFA